MNIRKSEYFDIPKILDIYDASRKFMELNGNKNQWVNYPSQDIIENDILNQKSFVCVNNFGEILSVFYFCIENDITYKKIDGKWLNNFEYGVVHRFARSFYGKNAAEFSLNWCFSKINNIKIDTHKDNKHMISFLNRMGFLKCGIIWLANGDERLAFQKFL